MTAKASREAAGRYRTRRLRGSPKTMGSPLTFVPLKSEEASDLYPAVLVLNRPDQIGA